MEERNQKSERFDRGVFLMGGIILGGVLLAGSAAM
jgi:hypothetical protein